MAAQLLCLRHAEAEPPRWDGTGGSAPDPPPTQRGRQQAEAAARLLGTRPRMVFVSEALRSRQTGAIIASLVGAPIDVVPALAEASMGSVNREPRAPGPAAEVLRQWIVCGNLRARLADGETGHAVALRMLRALHGIGEQCDGSLGIVVGHVASLTVGISALCQNGPALWGKPLPHATPFLLTVGSDGWHVHWPDASHQHVLP